MKKAPLFLLSLVAALSLAGCSGDDSSVPSGDSSFDSSDTSSSDDSSSSSSSSTSDDTTPTYIRTAISSLRKNNHQATIEQSTKVYYPNSSSSYTTVGLGIDNEINVAYSYSDGKAYYTDGVSTHYDTDSDGELVEGSESLYYTDSTRVFEEEGTGLAVIESLNPDNTVTSSYASTYDSTAGTYTPLIFASSFRNPWDYISTEDLYEDESGDIYLDPAKAEFVIECYGLTSTNVVESALVTLDSKDYISELTFTFAETGDSSYVRDCSLSISYHDYGDDTVINHVTPLTNSNPALATALRCLDGAESFTYRKQYEKSSSSEIAPNDTTGYFTKDAVFFHQHADIYTDDFYTEGDDYDYVSKLSSTDGKYYGYEYTYGTNSWGFSAAMISSTQQLVIDTFEENGPSFSELSDALFIQTGDLTYEADSSIVSWVGTYFDNGFDGVHSDILDGGTTSVTITLTEDEEAIDNIVVGCTMNGESNTITFYLSDIDETEIPEFARDAIDAINI